MQLFKSILYHCQVLVGRSFHNSEEVEQIIHEACKCGRIPLVLFPGPEAIILDGDNDDGDKNLSNTCAGSEQSKCGIGCPDSCLNGAFAAAAMAQEGENSDGSASSKSEKTNLNDSYGYDNSNLMNGNRNNSGNTTMLPGGSNVLVIGSAKLDGLEILSRLRSSIKVMCFGFSTHCLKRASSVTVDIL